MGRKVKDFKNKKDKKLNTKQTWCTHMPVPCICFDECKYLVKKKGKS